MGCITDYNIAISQIKTQQILNFVLLALKKSHLSARVMARLSNYLGMTRTVLLNCPIKLKSGQLIANQIWQFCYSYDYNKNNTFN